MKTVLPDGWTRPSGYSHGMHVPPDRALLFIAGQVGWDEERRVVSTDLADQFEQALKNVVAILAADGGRPEDVVDMTVFVTDLELYRAARKRIGEAWRRVMGKTFPTMTLIGVSSLLAEGTLVEMKAVAAVKANASS